MSIGWYPGHMVAARRKALETLSRTDVVLEVLDARLPGASSNPMIGTLCRERQRPCLRLLNKADLADPQATAAWLHFLGQGRGVSALAVSCQRASSVNGILRAAAALAPHRNSPLKPLRLLIMGIPNVGKSTLINALLKRRVALTGDQPALTRHQSRHDLDDRISLTDTPGLMWPAIEYPEDGLMLAASHAIGDNAYIDQEVALFLAECLQRRYPKLLAARYGLTGDPPDAAGLIEAIALRRGFRVRGGDPDLEKAERTLIHDYRSGALGRISLETPQSRQAMMDRARSAAPAPPGASPKAAPDVPSDVPSDAPPQLPPDAVSNDN